MPPILLDILLDIRYYTIPVLNNAQHNYMYVNTFCNTKSKSKKNGEEVTIHEWV